MEVFYELDELIQGGDDIGAQIQDALADKAREIISEAAEDEEECEIEYIITTGVRIKFPDGDEEPVAT